MSNATLEIGHTYAPDRLVPLAGAHERGNFYSANLRRAFNDTAEAQQLRGIADSFGEYVTRVALIDDVAVREAQRKSTENSWRWQHFLNASAASVVAATGIERSHLFYESAFEQAGRDIVAHIQDMALPEGHRLSRDGRKLVTGSGKNRFSIPLQGFRGVEDPSYPSCQALDTAWLQKRLTFAPEAITVLPAGYEEQQRGVEALAELMGIDGDAYRTVIYDLEGSQAQLLRTM